MTRYRYLKGNVTAEKLLEGIETRLSTYLKRQNSRTWDHVDYTSLPKFLHDNEFLLSGHRPELNSVTECLKTVFMVHSETGNIWTHGLGAVTCMFLSFYYLTYVARDWQHGLAFAVFFMGAVLCLGTSAVYHLFICHSEGVCKFLAKLRDEKVEATFNFSLQTSLSRALQQKLFKDLTFYFTPGVLPSKNVLSEIVKSSGGKVAQRRPSITNLIKLVNGQGEPTFVIISCEADLYLLSGLHARGIGIQSAEFILTGVMRQEVDFVTYRFQY